MKRKIGSILAVYFIIVATRPADAYLDPGSTSMIWQLLLGLLAGVAVFIKLFWTKLRSMFGFRLKRENHHKDSKHES